MIYIIESGDYFKVGFSSNVDKRLKTYMTHNPSFNLVKILKGDNLLEVYIHRMLRQYKFKNEWFYKFDNYLTIIDKIIAGYTETVVDEAYDIATTPKKYRLATAIKEKLSEDDFEKLISYGFITRNEDSYYANTDNVLQLKDFDRKLHKTMMGKSLMVTAHCYKGTLCMLNSHYPKTFLDL